jgi:N6-adenosine-specific RNA methylase IME4
MGLSERPLYATIVADPPWQYQKATQESYQRGAAENHYPTMRVSEIVALPVAELAADNAHLYLWVTNKILTEQRVDGTALEIVRAWGFEAKTILTWVKPQIGMGYYYRGCTEHIIFATRGKAPIAPAVRERNAFTANRTRHSAKPELFFDMVGRVSPGPYLELFARGARFGWDSWGDESPDPIAWAA